MDLSQVELNFMELPAIIWPTHKPQETYKLLITKDSYLTTASYFSLELETSLLEVIRPTISEALEELLSQLDNLIINKKIKF